VAVMAPALAVKVACVAPAGTVTEAGMVRAEEVSESETRLPPAGAAVEMVTVQVVLALESRLAAAHCSAEGENGAVKVRVAAREEPFAEAVMATV